jgi:hypothetical protein
MLELAQDGLIAGLLVLTLGLGFRLHLALRRLRQDNIDFEGLIGAIDAATERARSALEGLRRVAGEEGERLAGGIEKAQRLQDDLRFLCERGERLADRLAEQIEASRTPRALHAEGAAPPRPLVPPAADLERTLRTLR